MINDVQPHRHEPTEHERDSAFGFKVEHLPFPGPSTLNPAEAVADVMVVGSRILESQLWNRGDPQVF